MMGPLSDTSSHRQLAADLPNNSMADGGSRFEEAICDLCGKAASPEEEECVTVVCATKCSAPKDCDVYHDKCMSKYMRKFCKGMDLARRHGYPCPKGKGKGNSMSKPCKGKVVHHNKVIIKVKSAPAPLPDVDVQAPAVAAGDRVVGRLKAKRSLPEKAALGRPQPAPRATAAPKPAPTVAAFERPFLEPKLPKQDLLGRNLQAAQVQAKKAAKKNLQRAAAKQRRRLQEAQGPMPLEDGQGYDGGKPLDDEDEDDLDSDQDNSCADDEYAEDDEGSDWTYEEEVAAAMQRMPSAPGALAGNGADDLTLLDEGGCPAVAGWQQGGLDAAEAWAACGAGTADVDAAAVADAQAGTALQAGWAIAAMCQTNDDCWTLPAVSCEQLAGLGVSMAPGIQCTAGKGNQYTAGAGGETPRQPATLATGGRQLQGSMTTTGGSVAMGFGSGGQLLHSVASLKRSGSQPASWTASASALSAAAEVSTLSPAATTAAPMAAMAAGAQAAACSATFSATPARVADPLGSSTAAASPCSLAEWLQPPMTFGMQAAAASASPAPLSVSASAGGPRMQASLPAELSVQQQQGSTLAIKKYVPLNAVAEPASAAASPFAFKECAPPLAAVPLLPQAALSAAAAQPAPAAAVTSSCSVQPAFAAAVPGMPALHTPITVPAAGAGSSSSMHLQLLQQHLEVQRRQQQQQASVGAATGSQFAALSPGSSSLADLTVLSPGQQTGLLLHAQAAGYQQQLQAIQQAQAEAARQHQQQQLEAQVRAQAAMQQQQLLHQQLLAQQQAEFVRQQLKQQADLAMQQQLQHMRQQAELSKQQQLLERRAATAGLHRLSITTYPQLATHAPAASPSAAAAATAPAATAPASSSSIRTAVSIAQQQPRAAAKLVKAPPPGFDHLPISTARRAAFSAVAAPTSSSCTISDVAGLGIDQEASDDQLLALLCC